MKGCDVMTIGHISLDYNIDYLDRQIIEVGGAVIYSSAAVNALGHSVLAVTKLANADRERLSAFAVPSDAVVCLSSDKSTSIRNKYFTENKEKRECRCISQGDAFSAEELPDIPARIYHLAGLIYGDFDGEMIKNLAKKGQVAVDVQAFLRHADKKTGEMYFCDWAEKKELLPYITYFKTDAAEAEILTGTTDRYEAARLFIEWGAKEAVITHCTEVICYDGKEFHSYPLKPRNLSGRSGRGDTTFAAYISERLYNTVDQSLLYAAATVSNKMEAPGAYKGTRADIDGYIAEFYKD